jgi:hypothetical protein
MHEINSFIFQVSFDLILLCKLLVPPILVLCLPLLQTPKVFKLTVVAAADDDYDDNANEVLSMILLSDSFCSSLNHSVHLK